MTNEKITLYIKAFVGGGLVLSKLGFIAINCILIWAVFFGNRPKEFNEHMVYGLISILCILFADWIYTWIINYVNENIQLVLLVIFIAYCVASAAASMTILIRLNYVDTNIQLRSPDIFIVHCVALAYASITIIKTFFK